MCANGSTQHVWMDKEDKSSPTVSLEALMISIAIGAAEGRCVISMDIPNAFVQTEVGNDKNRDWIILILRNEIALILVNLDPDIYRDALEFHNGRPVPYLHVRRAVGNTLQTDSTEGQTDHIWQGYHFTTMYVFRLASKIDHLISANPEITW